MAIDKAWVAEWYVNDQGRKYTIPVVGETHMVMDSRFYVDSIPDGVTKLVITDPAGLNEIDNNKTIVSASQYKVDYNSGRVEVHSSLEATSVTSNYDSRGVRMLSATSIYINGDETANLQEWIEDTDDAITAITGSGSNALIGVYSMDAEGTADAITATYTGAIYFDGLKVNLTIANNNTGAVTFNMNNLGNRNVYKIDSGSKVELEADDFKEGTIVQIEDDGIDFIVVSSGGGGSGNMDAAIYDPNTIEADVYARANHTGTQTASTISDFDIEVSNNTDVSANTDDRHDSHVIGTKTVDETSIFNGKVLYYNGSSGNIEYLDVSWAGDMSKTTYDPTNIASDAFARANHTGTQTASTISDFDTEVSNNTTVTGKADTTDVLEKTNTTPFTPTADYHPSTKKYVDDSVSGVGGGDMLKTTYDPTNISASAFARTNHTGTQTASTISDFNTEVSNNTDVADNTSKAHTPQTIGTKTVDETDIGDGKVLAYNSTSGNIEYEVVSGSGDMTKVVYDPQTIEGDTFDRANHTGTQSADTITDGTTNKVFTAADNTKLDGIEAGAEVNNASKYISQTLPSASWSASATDYDLEKTVTVTGITATDICMVAIDKNSQDLAVAAELSASVDSGTNTLTFYATTAPTADITFDVAVIS